MSKYLYDIIKMMKKCDPNFENEEGYNYFDPENVDYVKHYSKIESTCMHCGEGRHFLAILKMKNDKWLLVSYNTGCLSDGEEGYLYVTDEYERIRFQLTYDEIERIGDLE